MSSENEVCPICGNYIQPSTQTEESGLSLYVYSCAICGKFKTNILPFDNAMRDMLASYLFCNIRWFPEPETLLTQESLRQIPFLITTEEGINNATEEYLQKHTIVTLDEVKRWYPRTPEEKIDKIIVGLTTHVPYEFGCFTLKTEELYSAFFVKRYGSSKVSDNKLQAQVEEVYSQLDAIKVIAKERGSFAEMKKRDRHDISMAWEGQRRILSINKERSGWSGIYRSPDKKRPN